MPISFTPDFLYGTAWKEDRTAALINLPSAAAFVESIQPTSAGITSKRQLDRDWLQPIKPASSHAATCFCKQSSPIGRARTSDCPSILTRPYCSRLSSRSLARSNILEQTSSIVSFYMDPPPAIDGQKMMREVWAAMCKAQAAGHTRSVGVSNVSLRHLEQMLASHKQVPALFITAVCAHGLGPRSP